MIEAPLGTATLTCTTTVYPSGRIAVEGKFDTGTHPETYGVAEFGSILDTAAVVLSSMVPEMDRATLFRWAENSERGRKNRPPIKFFTVVYAVRLWKGIIHDVKLLLKMVTS